MDDISDVFLNDVLIPQVFITDYLPLLGRASIQLYLLASLHKDYTNKVNGEHCRKLLGLNEEDYKAALLDLVGHQLVLAEKDLSNFTFVNLKRKALDQYYRPITSKPISESVESIRKTSEHQALINSVNNTYFQGIMGPSWYQAIDRWFTEYKLEPAVVYQMFVDAAERNNLYGPNYLDAVAKNYASNNIKNFTDLKKFKEEQKIVNKLSSRIGRVLNKNMSSYDKEIVRKWHSDYNYDFDIIEVALRTAVRLSEPNMKYFDKIISDWHEANIKSKTEAEAVLENNRRYKNANKIRSKSKSLAIEEREYSEDFYDQFIEYAYDEDETDDN